jgi:hypothetical protein
MVIRVKIGGPRLFDVSKISKKIELCALYFDTIFYIL